MFFQPTFFISESAGVYVLSDILLNEGKFRNTPSIKRICTIHNKTFIFDSGSAKSIVSNECFNINDHNQPLREENYIPTFSWIDPKVKVTAIGFINLNLDFGLGRIINWDFCVIEGIVRNLIGADLMQQYGMILNMETDSIEFNDEPVTDKKNGMRKLIGKMKMLLRNL